MSIPLLLVPRFCIDQPHEDNDMFAKEYVDIVLKQSLDTRIISLDILSCHRMPVRTVLTPFQPEHLETPAKPDSLWKSQTK